MSTRDLIVKLRALGIKLSVDSGELRVSAPKGVMTAELRDEMSAHKDQLLELLSAGDAGSKPAATRIAKADRNQAIPLSFGQRRMWFLEEFEGGTSIYNISWAMRLKGKLDVAALEGAVNDLVARHEALRTTFVAGEGEPLQVINPSLQLQLEHTTADTLASHEIQDQLSKWSTETFDLRTGPLLKARLVALGPDDHVLMLVIHHIVSDAWSLDILQRELVAFYIARSRGTDAGLDDLPIQFADYAVWQQGHINAAERERQLNYWQKQLAGASPLLELPTDRPRPNEQTYRGARIRRLMSAQLRDDLKALARNTNGTLFMVLLAAYDVLLHRYSGQDDIVVGTPIAGRQRSELEGLIGLFLNTLVMRADVANDPSFTALLQQVQASAMDAFAHQDLPFEKLVDKLAPERDMSYSPIFQVLFMLQNAPASGEPLAGLQIEPIEFDYGTAKFDLTLATGETPDGLVAEIEYSTDLFDAATIERMLEHYEILLRQIVQDPAQPISKLELISAAERARLLSEWNATDVAYPTEATLQSLLEAQAAATPAAEALVFGHESLTYAQLNTRANQLAHCLISQGTSPDDLVGVCMERSVEMVVALLGVIKAGLAYVPLDPDYPQQRLEHMLEDANIKVLLSQTAVQSELPQHDIPMLLLDEASSELAAQPANNPPARAAATNLAYVIFTSGSTGRPKGVMNAHHGIVNRLLWMQEEYGLTNTDRVLQKTPFSFDVSVWEFFWPLLSGATLVMAKPGGHKDPNYLAEIINKERITTLHFVPSMLQVFLQDEMAASCASLKRVICSGEALSHDLQTRFYGLYAEAGLHNLYGPTEAAIDVTYWACPRDSTASVVPIGRPVANTHIYIVDRTGNPTPIGVPGELWIGGTQVARGYVNRPELTGERFIPDPFVADSAARVYKTGDLVRYRDNGVIEFLGRIDHQVKLRGFRIELGEIEASLDALPEIEQSLVLLREDAPGDKRLVAYISGADNSTPDIPALRQALQQELPDYMVPSAFVVLDAFPLLPNGKVDRKALPEPEGRRDLDSAFVPPRSPVEKHLAEIWSGLLRVDRVGIHDNFFDLGGDSILSIQIIARAAKVGLHLTPKQVFRHQTIAELAETVGTEKPIDAEQGLVTGDVHFTPVEAWFLEHGDTDTQHFNQSIMLQVDGSLSADLIQRALREVYLHHDALRLTLLRENGKWVQRLNPVDSGIALPKLIESDVATIDPEEQAQVIHELASQSQASIDLASGCLLAARYFDRGAEQPALLLLAIHHLAIDGVGWRVLLEDIETACRQLLRAEVVELPAKTSSFKAWADHLHDYAQSAAIEAELDYWQAATANSTRLPLDKPDGSNSVGTARTVQLELDAAQTTALLKDAPGAYRTRINDILLTALGRAVSRWTGTLNCLVDLEGHGREQLFDDLDVSRTLGWFTSIYPVRLMLTESRDPGSDLKAIKEQIRQIPGNGIGYGLLRYTARHEELANAQTAEILFNYLGQFDQTFGDSGLFAPAQESTGPDQSSQRQRSHLLDINGSILQGKLRLGITYSKAIHNPSTIQRLADLYTEELHALIAHCLLPQAYGRTPSDFPLCTLDQPTVDRLCASNRDIENMYPVTPMQHGMLFHSIYEAGRDAYLSQVIWKLEGTIDADAFARAWQLIADRHAALRTGIATTAAGEPLQVAYKKIELPLGCSDWRDKPEQVREQQLLDFLEEDRGRSFDLEHPPLIRLNLFRFAEREYRFIWTYHHIVIDGWSVPVVIGELMDAYQAFAAGHAPNLGAARSFGDYVEWLCRQEYGNAETFWRQNLAGLTAPTELPAAKMPYNPALGQGEYAESGFSLDSDETSKIKEFARQHRLTLNTLVQGVWSILLSRYSTDEQIIFGATTSGRPAELKNVESMVGLLINALPVSAQVDRNQIACDWLVALQEQQLEAREYEFASLVEVQGWSDVPRGIPLFNTLLVFENYPEVSSLWSRSNDSLAIKDMQPVEWTNYPLTAAVSVTSSFHLRLDYDQQYYASETIEQIARHFLTLLAGIVAAPDSRIGALPMLDPGETQKLLYDWNDTRFDYPGDLTVHGMFELQAEFKPDAIALWHKGEELSYGELNRRANRLAAHLRELGIDRGSLVGISIDRCPHMIVGLLGILKSGAAYVPLDPKYPPDRVAFMLEDSCAPVLLTQESLVADLPEHSASLVCLDTFDWAVADQDMANPDIANSPEDLAYVIYTSGSTGIPKGVAIEHRNTVALIQWAGDSFSPEQLKGVLASTSVCFDLSVYEIFCTLGLGGRIVLVEDALALPGLTESANVTLVNTVPSAIAELVRMNGLPESVKTVNLAGEPLTTALSDSIYALGTVTDVNDLYGPSEDTTYSTWTRREKGGTPTIGRPVHNTQVYLLDPEGQPVPVGVPGELFLGGAGVTRGYLNRPELTAEKYVPDPFSKTPGARLYRTGDRARYRPDSNIEFLGRLDQQVKLRGFRIELGEIETRIEEHDAVDKALVIVREDNPGDQRLVAYLRAGTENLDQHQIEAWESEQVSQWEDLWQDTYSEKADVELGSDFSGWLSSYTGDAIPTDEMQVWIDTTADRINELQAKRILEIGSGTGLVASRVAPYCDHYLATDFSGAVIDTLQELKSSRSDLESLELKQARADELTDIAPGSYDAVIINSVAQYFPDADYFVAVVNRAVDMLDDGGHIFLGDLRNLTLLDAYHSSVQLFKASDSLTVANLASRIRQRIDEEEELLIDPAIFAALQAANPRISGVRFQLKRGTALNELTRFRYDVVVEVGQPDYQPATPEIINWRNSGWTLADLGDRLKENAGSMLLITGVPDSRLVTDSYAMSRFVEAGEMTVAQLRTDIAAASLAGIEPESIYELMGLHGWDVQLLAGETGTFNVLCRPGDHTKPYDGLVLATPRDAEWRDYTNNPLRGRLARSLEPLLRAKIKADLPEYMMPSAFIMLDEFPMTPNGKIDRKKLPAPEWRPQKDYLAPRTPTEEKLAEIWAAVLRLDRVGIQDDFFALGGHSLLATQVISRVRDQLDAEPELRVLFKHPTIEEFAAILDGSNSAPLADAIRPTEHSNGAVLSFAQQRLWFLDALEGGSSAYNIAWPIRLTGPLNIGALEAAFNGLIARHETLRTTFPSVNGEALQVISASMPLQLEVESLRNITDEALRRYLTDLASHNFNLETGPLFGARLLQLGDDSYILVILIHHIIADAWSMEIIYRDLVSLYTAALEGQQAGLPILPVQYADYAIWQRKMLGTEESQQQLDYWKKLLADAPPRTELPTDRPRPAVQTYAGATVTRILPADLASQLKRLAQQQSTTLFVLMQTVFSLLLARYSGQDDIVIGTPISGRKRSELENLIGFFLNTLALRTRLEGNPQFTGLLADVRENTFAAYEHQDIPFERLVDELQPVRDMSHSPIFQIMFTVVSPPGNSVGFADLRVAPVEYDYEKAKFDLMLSVNDYPDNMGISFEYNTDLFDRATIERMHEHFGNLLNSIVADPACRIRDLEMLGGQERCQLLTEWNATDCEYPGDLTVHAMFERQSANQPDAIALWANGNELSYGELNRRANRLAATLQAAGARPGVLIGISIERTAHMMTGLLGILKSGAAYVPLDPNYPADRVAFMLADSHAPLIISQTSVAASLPETEAEIICLDTFDWGDADEATDNVSSQVRSSDLAYVIYTSGSTGKPKGVSIEHRNTVALMQWAGDAFSPAEFAGVLASTSVCFDLSVFEIFCTLGLGGRIVLAENALALPELPAGANVTLINTVPSAIAELVRSGSVPDSVITVNLAGEPLTTALADAIYATGTVRNVNDLYGPSEDTTYSTWTRRERGEAPTIGRPIHNTQAYLLDNWGHPVPLGAVGELYLGGAGVTRGYLNRPELTAEKYVADPFGRAVGKRLYRTGDQARYRPDGKLEFLGRIDQQVKLRGFRIELGEIEAALDKLDEVKQSLVMVREDSPGDKKLIAYVAVAASDNKPDDKYLRSALQTRLPEFMVPAAFVILNEFPLLPNGKINRKALPAPEWRAEQDYAAPRNSTEETLATIWANLLRLDRVGIHDNFFELGGDSILSIRIIARAAQQGLHLTPKQVFSHQTVAALAAAVGTGPIVKAEQGLVGGEVPLSPIQSWFLGLGSPNPDHFNQSLILEIDASIATDTLEKALHAVYLHHDALRLRFHQSNDTWVQDLDRSDNLPPLQLSTLSDIANAEHNSVIARDATITQSSIDLGAGCLMANRLFVTDDDQPNLLLLAIHHLAVDGISWGILLEDIENACAQLAGGTGIQLPAKTTSFKTWTERLRDYTAAGKLDAEIDYWNAIPADTANLPVDAPAGNNTVSATRTATVTLTAEETRQLLQDAPAAYKTRINDMLLTALARALRNWTGAERVLIDLEGHGREELFDDIDVSRTVGWFTSKYPVLLDIGDGRERGENLKSIKEQLRAIPGNGLGYGLLLQNESLSSAAGLHPEIVFNYLGQFGEIFAESRLLRPSAAPYGMQQGGDRRRPHLLDINSSVGKDQLQITIAYSSGLHADATIQNLADDLRTELRLLIQHCISPDAFGRTPSDFPLCNLQQAEVDRLTAHNREIEDIYPATAMQHGMLFHSIYASEHNAYLSQIIWKLEGKLDENAFGNAWRTTVNRHTSLRTGIQSSDSGEPLQIAYRSVAIDLHTHDWQGLDYEQQEERLAAFLAADRDERFDLDEPPLMRLNLFSYAPGESRFVWTYHHTVIDGWSIPVVIGELLECYLANIENRAPQLSTTKSYRDYIVWLHEQDRAAAKGFWSGMLAGITAPTELPAARIAYNPNSGQGEYHKDFFALSEAATDKLRQFARSHRLTLNTLVQGAWSILLSRYSGNEQIIFGATTSGRPAELENVESIVGLLINSLPVATTVDKDLAVIDWLGRLQEQQLAARQYEYSSLVEIQGWSTVPRGTPLFNTLLVFENYPEVSTDILQHKDVPAITYLQPVEWTHYPLTAAAIISNQFVLRLDYDTQYYEQVIVKQLGRHFIALLDNIVADADRKVADLPMLSGEERVHLLTDWNKTAVDYPAEATLQSLLEKQAAATPAATALVYGGDSLSYAALNTRANRLAHWLIGQGTAPDDLIGVCMERSIEMVVALLGIVKAGLAYVPLDPDYPEHRLEHMLEDANIKVLLTQSRVQDVLPAHSVPVLLLDEVELDGQPSDNPPARILPANLAYVIFTSGSTGRPKGVMNEHRGIVNRLLWMQDEYGLSGADRVLQKTPFSFDVSVWEFFWPLISGATLVVARPGGHKDPAYLAELINKERITTLHFVPSMLQVFLQDAAAAACTSLRNVICSGEALSHDLQTRFYKLYDAAGLHNLYGPTEAAIDVTYWACPRESTGGVVPIGRPVANTHIYIVDKTGNPTPVGVAGELWIGGIQVARGYVNRPELTAERFIADRFADQLDARIYKTGDLVRYRADGVIEFLGRIDHQVKLRGFRIELGEIEASLDTLPEIEQSLVLLREDTPGDKRLVAYISGSHAVAPDAAELRQALQQELPEYMLPSAFVVLDTFPLLPNGKVDRNALPVPEWHGTQEYVEPTTEIEKTLARIWHDVLKVEQVGAYDDFFELGGHSLLATQVVSKLRDATGMAPELRLLFSNPVLRAFAEKIEAQQSAQVGPVAPPLIPVPHFKGAPLSFAQQRLWFLDQLEGGAAYNVPSAIRLTGKLDTELLEHALNDLVARHESLRTIFGQNESGPVQIVAPELTLALIKVNMTAASGEQIAHELTQLSREPFDLARGPLLRLHALKAGADEHIILLVMHHIISDAWSLGILFRELMTFYDARRNSRAAELPPLPIQFADYAIWQRAWLRGDELERQLSYWKTNLAGAPGAITLPTDRPHTPTQTYNGAIISRTLSKELGTRLEALSRQHNATLFMTLLAVFNMLLARYSGEDDIVIGTPIAGRNHSETEGIIGFFLNTLCLRTDLSGNPDFHDLLNQVSSNTLNAYAHQDLPFESLVEAIQPVRDMSRSPMFQVLFTLQNAPAPDKQFENLQLDGVALNQRTAKFELSLGVQETSDGLLAGFEYNTDLFDQITIERMFDHFERLLEGVVSAPDRPVGELPMLDADEEQQLLEGWNKTDQPYPAEQTLHELFQNQVSERAMHEALVCDGQTLTYAQLDRRANQLAFRLRELGAGPDVLVALGTERSLDMVVGVLGILKSGAAYVPLDPAYPQERIAYMLEDSAAPILVTQSSLLDDMPSENVTVVCIDQLGTPGNDCDKAPADTGVTSTNLAYVIYTSGSTGKPKGVQLEHRSVVNFLTSMADAPGIDAHDRLLAVTTLCFDISILELLLPLTTGSTVVIATRDESIDGYALKDLLKTGGITIMQATPATWRMLQQSEWTGDPALTVLCGGEALDRELAAELHAQTAGVWNMYGPTETTIWSSCHLFSPDDPVISVGRPIANTQMYILDSLQSPVPAGVAGELFIAGDGVARGYKDRPELNAERFIANPFRTGGRMYRTGDLARFLPDGQVQIIGRTDFQVKLRGFRIELGEIEAALSDCAAVNQAIVVLREDTPGDQRLVAYLTTDGGDLDTNNLREQLYASLPQYMVPSAFVVLDAIPLTPNGKVNRKALPAPDWGAEQEYVAPGTPTEEKLAEIWQAVLQIERIGIHDNFFVLGGHSLLATQLVARIRHTMSMELPLLYIFDYPSIASLAIAIEAFRAATSDTDIDDEDMEDISI